MLLHRYTRISRHPVKLPSSSLFFAQEQALKLAQTKSCEEQDFRCTPNVATTLTVLRLGAPGVACSNQANTY